MANPFKAIGNFIKEVVSKFWSENKAVLLKDLVPLALPLVEDVSKLDWNGDGRVSAAVEIVDLSRRYGFKWGAKLASGTRAEAIARLTEHYSENDLKRYLVLGRLAASLLNRQLKLPETHILNAALELAVGAAQD